MLRGKMTVHGLKNNSMSLKLKYVPTEISAKRVSGVWDFKDEIRDQRFEFEQWQMTMSQMS